METPSHTPKRYHYPSPGFKRYWEEGRGRQLAAAIGNRFPDEAEIRLNAPLLLQTDKLADHVIREVMMPHGYQKTQAWVTEGLNTPGAAIPDPLKELIRFTLERPQWVDPQKLETGARLCRRSGARGLIVLRNYCLMGGYESSAINKPLIFTEALKKGAAKRMAETTEFWVKVIAENALAEPMTGLKECLTVRLMHAYARASILDRSDWKTEEWGQPLNQWDMIATNLGFSIVFLDGLRLLGMQPAPDEVEGLFHLWKYIGYLLGIPEDRLPDNEPAAIRALYCWTITQPPADEDTQALARALMNEPLTSNYPKKQWQKKRVVQVHLAYNYFFLGPDSSAAMGLPVKGWTIYPALLRFLTRIQESMNRSSQRALEKSVRKNRRIQEKIAFVFLKGHGRR
jgi:hypothetical protein